VLVRTRYNCTLRYSVNMTLSLSKAASMSWQSLPSMSTSKAVMSSHREYLIRDPADDVARKKCTIRG